MGRQEETKCRTQIAIMKEGIQEAENEGPFKTLIYIPFRRNTAEASCSKNQRSEAGSPNSNTHLLPTAVSEALTGREDPPVTHL